MAFKKGSTKLPFFLMRYYHSFIEFLLIAIILLAPFDYGGNITIKPLIVVSLISLLVIFSYLFKKVREGSLVFFLTPLNLPIFLFLFLSLFSLLYSIDKFVTLHGVLYLFNYAVLFLIVINNFSSNKDLRRILRIIISLATLFSLLGLFQYLTSTVPFPFCSEGRAYSIFITPNTFAAYLILVLPLLFVFFIFKPRLMNQATTGKASFATTVLLIIIIINWLAFLATQSRSGYISLFLSSFFLSLLLLRKRKFWEFRSRFFILFSTLLVSATIFFLHSGLFMKRAVKETALKRAEAIVSPFEAPSARARLKFYRSAIKVIKKYPFSGTGFHTFHLIYPSVKDPGFRKESHFYVHNDYLQVFSELGIFGFISFLALIFSYLHFSVFLISRKPDKSGRYNLKELNREQFALILGTLGGSLSLFIHSLFEFNFYIMALMITLFFYFALSVVVAKETGLLKREVKIKIRAFWRKPLYFLLPVFFLVLAFLVLCPLLSEIYTQRGNRFFKKRNYREAEKLLKKAVFFGPLVSNYHTNLATAYNLLGKREKAEQEYKKGVDLSPYRVKNCVDLGWFYLESSSKEEREKSLFYLKKATLLEPSCEFYNLRLGLAYQKLKKPEEAIEQFLIYQKFHPEDLRLKTHLEECKKNITTNGPG